MRQNTLIRECFAFLMLMYNEDSKRPPVVALEEQCQGAFLKENGLGIDK
jgi:hypothetical protein